VNIRTLREPTPEGRLAAVAMDEIVRQRRAKPFERLVDYADLRQAMQKQVRLEILQAQLEEAGRKPRNEKRVSEILGEISCLLI